MVKCHVTRSPRPDRRHYRCSPGPFLDMSAADWDEMIAVNLTGPTFAGQLVARHMVDRGGGGVILQNASIAATGG
jgi:NAD(P)-dependent dehydrogenase (short-subunit alcohol dehydrogenase family)